VLPVFARDWLHQPQKVMEQIRKMIHSDSPVQNTAASGIQDAAENPGTSNQTVNFTGEDPSSGGFSRGTATTYDHLVFERLRSAEGDAGKFWETATEGNKLIIRWGRTGTKGQIQLKTFPDEESAKKEKEKMIKEWSEKGYKP